MSDLTIFDFGVLGIAAILMNKAFDLAQSAVKKRLNGVNGKKPSIYEQRDTLLQQILEGVKENGKCLRVLDKEVAVIKNRVDHLEDKS